MKIVTTVIAVRLQMQSTAHAEEPSRVISRSGTTPPPNVLFITADDLGLQLGCYGDNVIETPQIHETIPNGW